MNKEDACKLHALLEQQAKIRRRRILAADLLIATLMFLALSSPMWLAPLLQTLGLNINN